MVTGRAVPSVAAVLGAGALAVVGSAVAVAAAAVAVALVAAALREDGEMSLKRTLRHLATTPWQVRRAFSPATLAAIEAAVRACESQHAGEIRSEEHTSELQSLMRTSYAVFCLKKKKYTQTQPKTRTSTHHRRNT